jgi:hypothetical protein
MGTLPSFTSPNLGSALLCPACDYHCLHHSRVEVYDRSEDEVLTTLTTVGRLVQTEMVQNTRRNPSPRRHGMRIFFYCEGCPVESSLVLYQHKGSTYVEWEVV